LGRPTDADKLHEAKQILEENGYNVVEKNKIKCACCGREKSVQQNNYWMGLSPLYNGMTAIGKDKEGNDIERSYVPFCKKCIEVMLKDADIDDVVYILRLLDRPYIHEAWESVLNRYKKKTVKPLTLMGAYLSSTALNYRELTFKDSDHVSSVIEERMLNTKEVVLSKKAIKILEKTWGSGFTEFQYEFLDNEMHNLKNNFECSDYGMEMILKEIAWLNLDILQKKQRGEEVIKALESRGKLMNDGNLKPVQASGANATDQMTYGLFIKKLENERPISEPDEEWEDVDGIKKYIRVWFLGHMCALMGITNKYSKEYYEELETYTVNIEELDEEE